MRWHRTNFRTADSQKKSWYFLKVATTLVDLLYIELMPHLSNVKQMYSRPIHLTHELILCIPITRGRANFTGDTTMKSPCWHLFLSLWPSDPELLWFAAVPSKQDLAIFMAPHGWVFTSCQKILTGWRERALPLCSAVPCNFGRWVRLVFNLLSVSFG